MRGDHGPRGDIIVKRVSLGVTVRRGRAIGVEITDPRQFDPERFADLLRSRGQPRIDREELLPPAVA